MAGFDVYGGGEGGPDSCHSYKKFSFVGLRLVKKENGCKSLKHLVNERALTTLGIFAGQSLLWKIVFVFDNLCCICISFVSVFFLMKDIPVIAVQYCLCF